MGRAEWTESAGCHATFKKAGSLRLTSHTCREPLLHHHGMVWLDAGYDITASHTLVITLLATPNESFRIKGRKALAIWLNLHRWAIVDLTLHSVLWQR